MFIAGWVGAMVCLLLQHLFARPASGAETHATQAVLTHLDDWVITPPSRNSGSDVARPELGRRERSATPWQMKAHTP